MLQLNTVVAFALITQVLLVSEILVSCGPIENTADFPDEKLAFLKIFTEELKSTVSPEIDPCVDFDAYVCKKTNISKGNVFGDLEENSEIVKTYLGSENLSDAEIKFKNFYTSCQRSQEDSIGKFVRGFHFEELPQGWPALESNWNGDKFDFLSVDAELNTFGASAFIDHKMQIDRQAYTKYVSIELEDLSSFKTEYTRKLVKDMLLKCGVESPDDVLNDAIQLEQKCEVALSTIEAADDNKLKTDFGSLKKEIPEVDWGRQMEIVYGEKLDNTFPVEIKNSAALRTVVTTISKLNPKVVANYLFSNFILYLRIFDEDDYEDIDLICYSLSLRYFKDILSGIYVKKFLDNDTKKLLRSMVQSLLNTTQKFPREPTDRDDNFPQSFDQLFSDEDLSAFSDENLKNQFETVEIDSNCFHRNMFLLRRYQKSQSRVRNLSILVKSKIINENRKSLLSTYFSQNFHYISYQLSTVIFSSLALSMRIMGAHVYALNGSDAIGTSVRECFDRQLSPLRIDDDMLRIYLNVNIYTKIYNSWADKNPIFINAENELLKASGLTRSTASWEEWWTYDGISGPGFWGLINPQWNMCNKGRRQSPIDVEPDKLLFDPYLRPLHIDKHKVSGTLHNTGQSLVFRVDKDTKQHVNISGGPLAYRYQFEEIYIHYGTENSQGSEHRIHGYSFPGEIQLYGFNKELYHNMSEAQHKSQGIVGISLMVQIGETPNPELRIITSTFNKVLFRGFSTPIRHISLRSLLPNTEQYMTYEGSTTHPGCWESTVWIIINKPIYITKQELYQLRRLMQGSEQTPKAPLGNNARPLQHLHHRTIRTNIDFKNSKNLNCPTMYKDMYYRANKWTVDSGMLFRGRDRSLSDSDTVFHSLSQLH